MTTKTFDEVVDQFIDENKLYRTEGRTGVTNLCRLVNAMGYKDTQYFGQLDRNCSIGDLIEFLEDSPGAIEAVVEWIKNRTHQDEWKEELESQLKETSNDEENE